MIRPLLYIFGGLPGTGKSTLASALAGHRNAAYIRIDTVEQAMREGGLRDVGSTGYVAGYRLSLDNLRLGNSVVADSVNPLGLTRHSWVNVAKQARVRFVEIEVICSDQEQHRNRVESRESDIAGLRLPDWNQVIDREYETWIGEHLVLDTANHTVDESISNLYSLLQTSSTILGKV